MEKSCNSSADSNTNTNRNQTDPLLKNLSKTSHKISKPHHHLNHLKQPAVDSPSSNDPHQQQPPVYNIDKTHFRDVVQKLTGSSTPLPQNPNPNRNPSSRLHGIRPPPLAHVRNTLPPATTSDADAGVGGTHDGRLRSPFSPLPPFPTVSAAAESPISAYMRCLGSSFPASADAYPPMNSTFLLAPASPLAFGHIPLLSPSMLLSPSSQLGFPSLPLSPGLLLPSPRWKDL